MVPPPRSMSSSAAPMPPYSAAGAVVVPASLPPPVAVPGVVTCAVPGAPALQTRIICSQTVGVARGRGGNWGSELY